MNEGGVRCRKRLFTISRYRRGRGTDNDGRGRYDSELLGDGHTGSGGR